MVAYEIIVKGVNEQQLDKIVTSVYEVLSETARPTFVEGVITLCFFEELGYEDLLFVCKGLHPLITNKRSSLSRNIRRTILLLETSSLEEASTYWLNQMSSKGSMGFLDGNGRPALRLVKG